ncbi:MAG TPA: hypothetical protein VFA67_17480 [Candidatus Sulfotelmatobacter sp.]|nr:hypothetical protein [Candidatus Sulfotelmatobacter sp.]
MAPLLSARMGSLGVNVPSGIVVGISLVIGLAMVIVFSYTSDQKAIHVAKDRLKAHLLALRLFQDQIHVVLASYGRIILATGHYLRLAFKPLLFVIVPMTFLIVQLDRYLGSVPLSSGQFFLLKVRMDNPDSLDQASLRLPEGLISTAPPVHVPAEKEVGWRLVANKAGDYVINVQIADQIFAKRVIVGSGLPRLSSVRLRGRFWERIFVSGETALPENTFVEGIEVQYPARNITFAGIEWNWIWLFFVLSLAAGFLFKSILGVEI